MNNTAIDNNDAMKFSVELANTYILNRLYHANHERNSIYHLKVESIAPKLRYGFRMLLLGIFFFRRILYRMHSLFVF